MIPLYAQSLRLVNKTREAEDFISKMSDDINSLPIIKLEKAILLYQKEDFQNSKKILEELVSYAVVTDFSIEAENYLNLIKQKEKEKQQQKTEEEKKFS